MNKKNRIIWVLILSLCLIIQTQSSAVCAKTLDIILEEVTLSNSKVSKGDTFTASFVLSNIRSTENYQNVYIQVPSTSFSVKDKGSTFLAAKTLWFNSSVSLSMDLICHDTLSNQIPIVINYEDYSGNHFTINEQILVTFTDTPKEVETTKYKPEFMLTKGGIQTIGAGTTMEMSINIVNNSEYAAKNVVISPQLAADFMDELGLNQVNMEPYNIELLPGLVKSFEFNITANGIARPGIYPILYQVKYQNKDNDTFTSLLSGYIKITESSNSSDVFVVSSVISPEKIVRDSVMTLTLEIENALDNKMSDLNIWVEGLPETNFTYQGETSKKNISIDSESTTSVTFDYLIAKNAIGGNYPYEVYMSYTDQKGNSISSKDSFLLYLEPEQVKKGTMEISNLQIPTQGVTAEKLFTIGFDLCNTGENDLENIEVIMNNSPEVWSESFGTIQVDKLSAGESKTIEYDLKALKQLEDKNYPITFQIQYDEKEGEEVEIKSLNQSFGVLVNGYKETATQPKIIIDSINVPEKIIQGESFDLDFSFTNTSTKKNIKNIKMTLSSIDTVTQISNIITIGQSDSIFVAQLDSGDQIASKMKLMIPTSYKSKVCDIKCNFTYEDAKGNIYTDQEAIHLPIAEDTKLSVSDVRLGMAQEEGYTLELDFYNTGKGLLKNLMVDLEGDFESTNSNYYVGDFQSGSMDIYSVYINEEIREQITGNVIFTYEDASGVEGKTEVPFDIHYTEPVVEVVAVAKETDKESFPFTPIIIGAVVVIGAGLIIRKKRKAV